MQIGHEHRWLSGVVVLVQLGDTGWQEGHGQLSG